MVLRPAEALILPDLCRNLVARGAPDFIASSACLDKTLITRLVKSIGTGPTYWALEEAANLLPHVEEDFRDIAELPRREIGAHLEAWILDIIALLMKMDRVSIFVRSMPQIARGAAQLNVPFERITRSIRKAQGEYTTRFFMALADRGLKATDYEQLVSAISCVTDDGVSQFVVHYLEERAKLLNSQTARRHELIRALIASTTPMSRSMAIEIGNELGLCIDHFHTGFVVVHRPNMAAAEQRVIHRDLRGKLRNADVLVQADGHTRTSFWITTTRPLGASLLETVSRTLAEFPGAVRTMGESAAGPQGFRQTHLQASDLAEIAPRLASDGVLRWSDHALTLALGSDLERARWFVRSALAPLADPTEKADEYRRTLQAYLSSGQSLLHAAEQRNVHRNTVVYRLQQIEQLLGHSIRERALELQCALHLIAQFGNHILDSETPTQSF